MDENDVVAEVAEMVSNVIVTLQGIKPNDRSERDRRFAIIITEFEKDMALIEQWLL